MANSAANSILCVDIGGTSTKAGALLPSGDVRYVDSIASQPDAASFLENLVSLIRCTLDRLIEDEPRPSQLGVAVAGFLDAGRTSLLYNSNLQWLEGYPLRRRLRERFPDLEIELEIDSNAAAIAEYKFGTGRGKTRFLCLTCGTGLGVGMIVDGAPLRFAYGCMGDIGHTIVQRDGPLCTCGGRGCAEILISASTLAASYRKLTGNPREMTLRNVIEASQTGDSIAISVLERAGEWLGIAAASMANTFFPDHIAIAGGLSAAGDIVLKPAERMFRETACIMARSAATFGPAVLGSAATLIGAAGPFWTNQS